jgi:hypothetical protein
MFTYLQVETVRGVVRRVRVRVCVDAAGDAVRARGSIRACGDDVRAGVGDASVFYDGH